MHHDIGHIYSEGILDLSFGHAASEIGRRRLRLINPMSRMNFRLVATPMLSQFINVHLKPGPFLLPSQFFL